MTYYYPNMPLRLSPEDPFFDELDNNEQYVAEVKKNGWRMLAVKTDGKLELWTRRQTMIEWPLTELRGQLSEMMPNNTIIDGELIERRTVDTKGKAYIFDIFMLDGHLIDKAPLAIRRLQLKNIITDTDTIELAKQTIMGKKELYHQSIAGELNEGIVIKKLDSPYLISPYKCLDNPAWIKVKRIEEHVKRGL